MAGKNKRKNVEKNRQRRQQKRKQKQVASRKNQHRNIRGKKTMINFDDKMKELQDKLQGIQQAATAQGEEIRLKIIGEMKNCPHPDGGSLFDVVEKLEKERADIYEVANAEMKEHQESAQALLRVMAMEKEDEAKPDVREDAGAGKKSKKKAAEKAESEDAAEDEKAESEDE
jgi:hypothetical protein